MVIHTGHLIFISDSKPQWLIVLQSMHIRKNKNVINDFKTHSSSDCMPLSVFYRSSTGRLGSCWRSRIRSFILYEFTINCVQFKVPHQLKCECSTVIRDDYRLFTSFLSFSTFFWILCVHFKNKSKISSSCLKVHIKDITNV